ncbi:MAG: DNA polymerase III subunit gamma/tau [Gammaproteobacteria bacterium]|nr:DNA polymerase III subunit gamma/tau [Gammaproteobacteria bacterium]
MSYQVLARKWRPHNFREMVGQDHVLRALINALDNDRLHHAYLFTGTRGVGKTTIARIFAKSLNCEEGVGSTPCGVCNTCREIDEGRFVDLIEVDAASRTKVEDTRELLDNVQYAPTRGRFKVYLIDEVHMLSGHSFNALLKTLEEPPPHVKFLLATTDPQKLPVTILSRCLQFSLKRMQREQIVPHLQYILEQESIPFDESALSLLAQAADGSMRDALSLLDQAIAFAGGELKDAEVRAMLGTIDRGQVFDLLEALGKSDGSLLLQSVDQLAQQAPDFAGVLAELISALHNIAILQTVPEAEVGDIGERERLAAFAQQLSPEDVQLYYQIALTGRRDLPLAPDARGGFEMVLLRMLAFRPAAGAAPAARSSEGGSAPGKPEAARVASPVEQAKAALAATTVQEPQGETPPPSHEVAPSSASKEVPASVELPDEEVPAQTQPTEPEQMASPAAAEPVPEPPAADPIVEAAAQAVDALDETTHTEMDANIEPSQVIALSAETWADVVAALPLQAMPRQFALNSAFVACEAQSLELHLAETHAQLHNRGFEERVAEALSEYYGQSYRVKAEIGPVDSETPSQIEARKASERQAEAELAIQNDPNVRAMVETFDAQVQMNSIQPKV